jgi:hypothetical protein
MGNEKESLKTVCQEVAPEVDELYQYFRKNEKNNLEEENDTLKQLDILVERKFIPDTYISDLMLMTDYYERELYSNYIDSLSQYKFRITFFLD